MRRAAIIFALLIAVSAEARTRTDSRRVPRKKDRSALRVLPNGNLGMRTALSNFCSAFASELTGSKSFCLNGDGTQVSNAPLSAVGSPATQSQRMCPNGPNCGSYTSQRITSGNRFATANVASPSGSFSLGCFIRADSFAAFQEPLTHWAGTNAFTLELNTGGGVALGTNDGTATTSAPTVTMTAGVGHLVGASFTFVGAGAVNTAVMYLDGVAGTPSVTMRPPQAAASVPMVVGSFSDGSNSLTGNLGPCFLTEKVITAQTWAAMASAIIPTVSGSRGETITFSRSSVATCTADDGSVSVLPSGRPCVNGNGLLVEPTGTNTIVRSEEIDNVAWSSAGTPTTTANQYAAPNGTLTADKIVTTGSGHARNQIVTVASTTSLTGSAWVRSDTGTSAESVVVECNGTTITGCTCATSDGTSCSTATFNTPDRCAATATVGTTPVRLQAKATCAAATITGVIYLAPGQYGVTFGTGGFWGAQLETGPIATSYIPTAGTAAARNAVAPDVATTGWPTGSGSVEISYTPASGTAAGIYPFIDSRTGPGTSGVIVYRAAGNNISAGACDAACTSVATGALSWNSGQTYRIRFEWRNGTGTIYRDDVNVGTGPVGIPTAHNATAKIGYAISGERTQGYLSNLSVRP